MKRLRESDSDAELEILNKCSHILANLVKGETPSSVSVKFLKLQFDWLLRKAADDALKHAQKPETLTSRMSPVLHNALAIIPNRWSAVSFLHNAAIDRNWSDTMDSRLHLMFDIYRRKDGDYAAYWSGSVLCSCQSIDPTHERSSFTSVDDILLKSVSIEDAVREIVLFNIQQKRLSVYSSNDELLALFL